jgi:hypothetical protein
VGPAASWSQCIATHSAWPLVPVMGGRPASFLDLPLVFVDRLQLQAAMNELRRLSRDIDVRFFFFELEFEL